MLFFLVLRNRLRLLFADWRFLVAMVALPLFLSAVTGNALDRQKRTDMPILIVDLDETAQSRALVEGLSGKDGLAVRVTDAQTAARRVEDNQTEAALTIPKGYERRFLQQDHQGLLVLSVAASADSRGFLTELIAGEVFHQTGDAFAQQQIKQVWESSGRLYDDQLETDIAERYARHAGRVWLNVDHEVVMAKPPEAGKGTINYPPAIAASLGLMVLFLLFGTLFGAGWMAADRQNGTLDRFISIRGIPMSWFLGNWTALFLLGLALAIVLVAGSWFLYGVWLIMGIASWVLLLGYLASLSSIGLLFASLFRSTAQLQAAVPVLAIVSGFAGGCLWNQMGSVGTLPLIALSTPQGWVLQALGRIYAYPGDTTWKLSASVLIGVAGLTGAIAFFRIQHGKRRV